MLKKMKKRDNLKLPKTIQEIIPIRRIYDDGIFLTEDEYYTIQYRFTDINFSVAGYDNLKEMSDGYQNILKSVDVEARMKITINNRKINPKEFRDNVLLKLRDEDDGNNSLRKEYNEILKEKLRGRNNIIQERLLTISIKRKTIEEARIYFGRTFSSHSNTCSNRSYNDTSSNENDRFINNE